MNIHNQKISLDKICCPRLRVISIYPKDRICQFCVYRYRQKSLSIYSSFDFFVCFHSYSCTVCRPITEVCFEILGWTFHWFNDSWTVCISFMLFWKEEASVLCWPCGTDHAVQTDLWLGSKEIESACWRYSNATSTFNLRPKLKGLCFHTCCPSTLFLSFNKRAIVQSPPQRQEVHENCVLASSFGENACEHSTCCKSYCNRKMQ